jgi:hypothetical protein
VLKDHISTLRIGGCEISARAGLISIWHSVGAQSELRSAQHQMSRENHRDKSDGSNSMRGIMWVMCHVCVANIAGVKGEMAFHPMRLMVPMRGNEKMHVSIPTVPTGNPGHNGLIRLAQWFDDELSSRECSAGAAMSTHPATPARPINRAHTPPPNQFSSSDWKQWSFFANCGLLRQAD